MVMSDLPCPQLSPALLDFFRSSYGVLLLGHLLWSLPQARRFLLSERWGGYGQTGWLVDGVQNPLVLPLVLVCWLTAALLLAAGWWVVWAALANLLLCRYFFLRMRWRGVLRGMGAPGFMTCWLAGAVLLLEFSRHHAPSLSPLTLLVLQVDFALIMLTAGLYKFVAGYTDGEGMEYGLANPQWSRWWRFWKRWPPGHAFFRLNNHLAWAGELIAGSLMLLPPTRAWGAGFILLSFVYIALQLRLLFLPPMVMLGCVLFFGSATAPVPGAASATAAILAGCLWAYLVLLPLAYAGLFYNFYARKRLPEWLQSLLDGYASLFGLSLWRVFSADHTRFFIEIHRQPRAGGKRQTVSRWGHVHDLRYSHVAEAITVTSLFTTRLYYPAEVTLLHERLLRYARTVPCPPEAVLVFVHVEIRKTATFEFVPVSEYIVDPVRGIIHERTLDVPQPRRSSPIFAGTRPGSYAPSRT
jgi:hypothetical protein